MLTRTIRRAVRRAAALYCATKTDRLAERAERRSRLSAFSENGQIAVVHGGIDCDGTMVDNQVEVLPFAMTVLEAFVNDLGAHAEGPWWVRWAKPSEIAELRPVKRDLALEAFEDGHPHLLRA